MKRRAAFGFVKAVIVALTLVAACGRTDGGRQSGSPYDPCAGRTCGARCTICDPHDPRCAETAVLKYCSAQNECVSPYPVCTPQECKTDGDCPQIESCGTCPDGSFSCPEARCVGGQCSTVFPPCPAGCKTSDDCPQLGMPCQVCSDGSVACPGSLCVAGECVVSYPRCDGYDPCQGKACGSPCTVCDPRDTGCVETAVLKFCDAGGACGPHPTCNDVCALPADPGPCDAYMPRWYFDHEARKCSPFVFGGCQGNGNNFQTPAVCVNACAPTGEPPCDTILCGADAQCLYSQDSVPACAAPCAAGDVCPPGFTCECGASCPGCKNCVRACIPAG
jgi:hypothetical protein